jgi:hypothetical protein
MPWSPFSGFFLDVCSLCSHVASPRRGLIGAQASWLLSYYRQRISISLQRSRAQSIHYQLARAIQSTLGARCLAIPSRFVSQGDLFTVIRASQRVRDKDV